ncbi:MAG: hypothetical protein JWO86_6480 [Myxococcaceae bacterium]|nr:hypothetical protein [Myxococcaceae bacterium]MEA2746531.1 hypothetical protein [Myxococcales bacterium]
MERNRCTAAVVAALALTACTPTRYGYAPVTTTSAELEGSSAAVYAMPPDAPRGEVRIAMLGVAESSTPGMQETRSRKIHVALAVSNRADETWTVDPSEQRLTLTNNRERSDVYATTRNDAGSSSVIVPPRSTRVIDLYFPVPIQLQKDDALPPFDIRWTVHAAGRSITQRTPFERFLVAPAIEQDRDLRRPDELFDEDPLRKERPEHKPILPLDDSVE